MQLRARPWLLLLALLGALAGCAQVKPAEEFAFQTEAERLDAAADVATDAVDTDQNNADADDPTDVADAPDAVDAPDAADSGDVADAMDSTEVADSVDVADVADVADSADVADAADVTVTADVADASDVADVSNPCPTVNCDDGDPCSDDSCVPFVGCKHSPGSGKPCAPDPCHSDGTCDSGVCKFAVAISCDDGNDCTVDSCGATAGCTHISLNNGNCVGDLCFISQTCKAGVCQGGSAKACDDANVCTDDSCDAKSGCVHLPNAATCDDGDACTGADACAGGKCAGVGKFPDATFGGPVVSRILSLSDGFAIVGNSSITGAQPWLVRTDLAGKLLWQMAFDSNHNGLGTDVLSVSDGYLVLGSRDAGGGASQVELFHVDFAGNLLSENHFDAIAAAAVSAQAIVARAGGYAIAGSDPSAGGSGALILTDLSGDASAVSEFSAGPFSNFTALSPSGGGFILAGSTVTGGGSEDVWLVRVDGTGKQLWQQTYGGSGDESANSVISLSDGYLVAGQTSSKGAGGNDAWLVRTDLSGNKLWDKFYGGKLDDSALEVRAIPSGYAFSGTTASTGAGGNEMWLVRTDALGNKMFGFPYGGTGDDGGSHLALLSDGFALAGYTNSKGTSQQAWLLRTDLFGNTTCAASGACIAKSIADCSDGNPCTADSCAASNCSHGAPAAFACDDGLKCTGPDVCTANVCGGPAIDCNDNNVCTADSCDPEFGCVNEASDGGACGADKCTSAGVCSGGACAGATAIACNDGNMCTSDSCDLATGCTHTNSTGSCSSDGCLVGQVCSAGTCGGGTPKACSDGNPCTTDFCAFGNCAHGFLPNATTCTTGSDCVVDETCSGGACGGGSPKLWTASFSASTGQQFLAATTYPGGIAFVGSRNNASTVNDVWLMRTDASGQVKLTDKVFPDALGGDDQATAVVAGGDGSLVIVGSGDTASNKKDVRALKVDASDNVVWEQYYGSTDTDFANAAVTTPSGGYAIAGLEFQGGNPLALLVLTDASGAQISLHTYGTSTTIANAICQGATGGYALAGYQATGPLPDTLAVRVDGNGGLVWSKTYGVPGSDKASAIAPTSDGGFILGGDAGDAFALVRIDANGGKLWSATYPAGANSYGASVAALGDGFALAGTFSPNAAARFIRVDNFGNKLVDRSESGVGFAAWTSLFTLPDGFLLAGNTSSLAAPNSAGWAARTDSFGNTSCASSGTCASQTLTSCDDANPCTADICDLSGCKHNAMADGAACGSNKTCVLGGCF